MVLDRGARTRDASLLPGSAAAATAPAGPKGVLCDKSFEKL